METIESVDTSSPIKAFLSNCTDCGVCWKHCRFLKEFGTPYEIAKRAMDLPPDQWPDPFACSLCGLCGAVCPEKLRPEKMFLAMRRQMVRAGCVDFKPYAPIRSYEALGTSSLFSFLRLPDGGDTVLFPGCTLPGTRPETVRRLFLALHEHLPDIGVALGCCSKPSHDLGREDLFMKRFGRLRSNLVHAGVKRIVTTCPNCQHVFERNCRDIEAVTVYELLADLGVEPPVQTELDAAVHDPCVLRHDRGVQDAVRTLTKRCGVSFRIGRKERENTLCCGEGGIVPLVRPDLADAWTQERAEVVSSGTVVTSCAGCVGALSKVLDTHHVLDLMFDSCPDKPIKPPFTYWERLKLKKWFHNQLR